MSLNGLDNVKVLEAYQGALAEAGGWFLLKYTSRDAVEVLTRGTGGAADARSAIAQYEDKSPLYGFLLYRRRKVLIKYVPEGTSRLLQARVAVHFTTVTDKFTPHDTDISITTADELSDAVLASACSLHTAAPSSSSSSSSSQLHKLDDITEDVEEGQSTVGENATTPKPSADPPSTLDVGKPAENMKPETEEPAKVAPEPEIKSVKEEKRAAELSHVTIETVRERDENAAPKTAPLGKTFKNYDALFEDGPDPRLSSQTARPALSDLYAEIYAQYNKPKVRLGPRPKAPKTSLDMKRPHSSGTSTQVPPKAVSSLPSGLRAANRKSTEPKRPKSGDSSAVLSIAFPPPPPIPAVPDMPVSPTFAPKSPASVRSMPMHTYSGLHHGSKGVAPEKQRLMKALQMRKKQMKAKKEQEEKKAEATVETVDDTRDENKDAKTPTQESMLAKEEGVAEGTAAAPEVGQSTLSDEASATVEDATPQVEEEPRPEAATSHTEADDINSAASASSPISAETHGSSCAPSTRPSSISEDDPHLTGDDSKGELSKETVEQPEEISKEDEEASVESTPTVVAESSTPVPVVEVAPVEEAPMTLPQASASDDALTRASKRESIVFMSPSELDDARTQRKSKRESTLFVPPRDNQDLAESRKQKRASLIMSSPTGINFQEKDIRRGLVDPVYLSADNSEAEYLSDDSFMEELQSAKFEEAMPVSVSKSPITPFFPGKQSRSDRSLPTRTASQVVKTGRLTPEQPSSRKSSGPWLPHVNSDTVVTAKKINVSSGISQRIKALAEKSNRDSTALVSPVGTPEGSTSIVAQRKSSFFATPPSGNSPTGKPVQRLSLAPFASRSSSASPDNKPKIQPPSMSREQSRQTVYNIQQEPEKSESVQVTARIIRDPQVQKPTLMMPTESTPLDLRQSVITIDHQKSTRPPSRKQSSAKADPTSPVRPPSSSHSKDAGSTLPRSSSESSWRSFGRRMSESKPMPPPRSISAHSTESGDEKQEKKEKKESRASKLFKRMSTMPSSKTRKNSAASSMLSEEDLPPALPSLREPPSPVQIGDLNIQLPDTLLWKRRYVEIDVSGNLVLRPSKANELSKGITKRFHLTEFRAPYAPDQDRQELPNSVVFDFIDGRTLQCACETHSAQVHVLQSKRIPQSFFHFYSLTAV
ncbi:hypothetical protein CC80DRAFT_515301 [Byssothecium circinans]|uniref:ADF-H domain-containing protein n=1 Tax=Byssothecium circinans TaxID=147558 RepID=A0A6A5U0G4_9PLEO|nr:hypothetical protein CC80DRAFT_515301 [Byssothecium circinans]